ncbi:MAG: hypothetical protein JO129_02310 [Candidatus Dependentiae bacterium]|nr:hypothetical protein [Candidatus Dependentiae bacterium]
MNFKAIILSLVFVGVTDCVMASNPSSPKSILKSNKSDKEREERRSYLREIAKQQTLSSKSSEESSPISSAETSPSQIYYSRKKSDSYSTFNLSLVAVGASILVWRNWGQK